VNDFLRQADRYGQAHGYHSRPRTDPDDAERLTGIYGSEGWEFESLRARPAQRPVPILGPAFCVLRTAAKYSNADRNYGSSAGLVALVLVMVEPVGQPLEYVPGHLVGDLKISIVSAIRLCRRMAIAMRG
jgi:hypothetical protein